jgi:hypothetical protein
MLGPLRQESRGVAAENTKFRDCKGNEADVGEEPTSTCLLILLVLQKKAEESFILYPLPFICPCYVVLLVIYFCENP